MPKIFPARSHLYTASHYRGNLTYDKIEHGQGVLRPLECLQVKEGSWRFGRKARFEQKEGGDAEEAAEEGYEADGPCKADWG